MAVRRRLLGVSGPAVQNRHTEAQEVDQGRTLELVWEPQVEVLLEVVLEEG